MTNFLKYGLMAGVLHSVYSLVLFIIKSDLRFNGTIAFVLALVVPLIFMVMALKAERNNQEGLISFGEGLKTTFLTYLVYSLITLTVGYIIMGMWSAEDWESMAEFQRNTNEAMFSAAGMDQLQIEQMLEDTTTESIKEQLSGIGGIMMTFVSGSLFGLIMSLVISAIMKRNPTP